MENNSFIVLVCAAFLITGMVFGGIVFSSTTEIEVPVPVITEKIVMSNCSATPDYVLTQSEYEERAEENYAKELFLDSIESRDFKDAVFEALSHDEPVDSYEDITNIKYEYDVDYNEIEVKNLKVYYFIDGDEEENEKALFDDFTVEIDNLDFEDLSESEINEDYLTNLLVNKVY